MKINEAPPLELTDVRHALEVWRKARKHRQPIPETIWTWIAALARVHGVSAMARALRLDYYTLQRRVAQISQVPSAPASSEFVELEFPPSAGLRACVAELEDGRGRKLTLRWGEAPGGELLGIVRAFWKEHA